MTMIKYWHIIMPLLSLSIPNLIRILKLIVHHLSPDALLYQNSIQRRGQGSLPIISLDIFLFIFHYLYKRMTYNHVTYSMFI